MPDWLRKLAMTVTAFGASWTGAVWIWRTDNRIPTVGELALYLVAVPVALLVGAWALARVARRIAAPVAAPSPANATAQAVPAPEPAPPMPVILAASVHMPHGGTPADVAAALADGTARPALDRELVDDQGFPILSARVADVDVAGLQAALDGDGDNDGNQTRLDGAQWRALALGTRVADELAAVLAAHPARAEHAARLDPRAPSPLPMLYLRVDLAHGWSDARRALAERWLRGRFAAAGWPIERIATADEAVAADTPSLQLAALLTSGRPDTVAAVLACASQLDAATIDSLADGGGLLTARSPHGQIPGEGAAGLLLAGAVQARLLAPGAASLPAMRALLAGPRPSSMPASSSGRADAPALAALAARALASAQCPAEQVALVTGDADQQSGPILEVMGAMAERLPHLDPATDLVRTTQSCGACAPVPWLAALALAADAAAAKNAAVLCVATLDPHRRDVAVVAPATLP